MKPLYRSLSLILFALLLTCGLSLAASSRVRNFARATTIDCAGDCAERRDKAMERCNNAPAAVAQGCRDMANKQYNKCVERCNGGGSDGPSARP